MCACLRAGRVVDAPSMTNAEIAAVKQRDRRDKDMYIQLLKEKGTANSPKNWLHLIGQRGRALLKAFWLR